MCNVGRLPEYLVAELERDGLLLLLLLPVLNVQRCDFSRVLVDTALQQRQQKLVMMVMVEIALCRGWTDVEG